MGHRDIAALVGAAVAIVGILILLVLGMVILFTASIPLAIKIAVVGAGLFFLGAVIASFASDV